ncbi:DUF6480 family protein [Streptomyces roseolus]|uniref:DUF6480 family protein n=1 Tax=Streptomyces roseolus TaxID=67358 RepID=UPI0019BCD1E9|nr:DUF6480 family protein [Streptomyces roseolus]GGR26848.1 hypothetical protein GCM10010282_19040 [Streptomyces roseolus]
MTTTPSNPDPDPTGIPGSIPEEPPGGVAGGVGPGETPPAESGTGTATGPYRPLSRGWTKGPLVAMWVVVVLCALFFLVYAILLATG